MTTLDIILLLCFLPAIWFGLKKGLVHQLVTVVSLVLGIWVAYRFSSPVAAWLGSWMEASAIALKVASYILIFIGVAAVMRIVGWLIEKVLQFAMLGWFNRACGLVLAVLGTCLVLGVAIMLFNSLNVHLNLVKEEALADARVYHFLKDFAYTAFPFMKEMLF